MQNKELKWHLILIFMVNNEINTQTFTRNLFTKSCRSKGIEAFFQNIFSYKDAVRYLLQIYHFLSEPKLINLTERGNITLASIKPRLDQDLKISGILVDDDSDDQRLTEKLIESEIKPDFTVLGKFNLVLDHHALVKFYNPKGQLKKPPIDRNRYGVFHQTRWHEAEYWMTHWPTTFLILYSDENATEKWRRKIGTTFKLDKLIRKEWSTLRAKYELSEHNSIFHGSSNPTDCLKELGILAEFTYGLALDITRYSSENDLGEYFFSLINSKKK